MGTILDQLPSGVRVAVIHPRSLGDCVLTTPALEYLKRTRPDLRIAIVVETRFAPLFEGNPDIEEILAPQASTVRRWSPSLALNLHGGIRSLLLALASGARFRAGFAHFRWSFLYNVRIPTAQEILGVQRKVHTAEHLASAMLHLGASAGDIPRAKLFAASPAAAGPYAVIHPFASAPEKTWPAERFLALAAHLKAEPVFVGGAADDVDRHPVLALRGLEDLEHLLLDSALGNTLSLDIHGHG